MRTLGPSDELHTVNLQPFCHLIDMSSGPSDETLQKVIPLATMRDPANYQYHLDPGTAAVAGHPADPLARSRPSTDPGRVSPLLLAALSKRNSHRLCAGERAGLEADRPDDPRDRLGAKGRKRKALSRMRQDVHRFVSSAYIKHIFTVTIRFMLEPRKTVDNMLVTRKKETAEELAALRKKLKVRFVSQSTFRFGC
jgi:hypothetical protein